MIEPKFKLGEKITWAQDNSFSRTPVEIRAIKTTVMKTALGDTYHIEYLVPSFDWERWVDEENCTLWQDTVTIEIPRKVAEYWNLEAEIFTSYVPEIQAIIEASQKALHQ